MKNSFVIILLISILLVSGCAGRLAKQDIETVKVVAIENTFLDFPTFTVIGITVFNNDHGLIKDKSFKNYITKTTKNILKRKGYKVVIQKDEKAVPADIHLKIIPSKIHDMIGTFGYGVHEKSAYSINVNTFGYIALNLQANINGEIKGHSHSVKTSDLVISDLPESWLSLSRGDRISTRNALKRIIILALKESIEDIGL